MFNVPNLKSLRENRPHAYSLSAYNAQNSNRRLCIYILQLQAIINIFEEK